MSDNTNYGNPIADFEQEIVEFLTAQHVPLDSARLSVPPSTEFGEASSNAAFLLAKERRQAPRQIATDVADEFDVSGSRFVSKVEAAGNGFINFFLDYRRFVPHAIASIESAGVTFGRVAAEVSPRWLVEHTSVNPNKEWHVGHLRNVVIGDVLARVARQAGAAVEVQNYIDDTGRQAAEAVLAMTEYNPDEASATEKFDHFIGRYYVQINQELSEGPEERVQELQGKVDRVLHEMEEGKHRVLIEQILRAQLETAARIGATYDSLVWESDIVRAHLFDEAIDLLRQSPKVFVPEDGKYAGALVIELDPRNQGQSDDDEAQLRVLIRSNGLPTYTGKDIPYMMWKFGLLQAMLDICDFPSAAGVIQTSCPEGQPFHPPSPDRVVNVVADHQALQQQTVIEGLTAAGYPEQASHAHHLSYGMVSQSEGRISGRKGSGIAADTVLDDAAAVARSRVVEKQPDIHDEELDAIAEAIAVGSLRYLMVQYSPVKPILFDLQDVVSFEGNTGLYLQYALVRVRAILRKAAETGISGSVIEGGNPDLLTHPAELALIVKLCRFPSALDDVLRTLGVNIVGEYAHSLASDFSQFYRDCPIIQADPETRLARLRLLRTVDLVMTNALSVLGIPTVDKL